MKNITFATAAITMALFSVGCFGEEARTAPNTPVEITESWAELGLPTEEGIVTTSDPYTLSVLLADTTVEDASSQWFNAVQSIGYSLTKADSDGKLDDDLNTAQFENSDSTMTASIIDAGTGTLVILTKSPKAK